MNLLTHSWDRKKCSKSVMYRSRFVLFSRIDLKRRPMQIRKGCYFRCTACKLRWDQNFPKWQWSAWKWKYVICVWQWKSRFFFLKEKKVQQLKQRSMNSDGKKYGRQVLSAMGILSLYSGYSWLLWCHAHFNSSLQFLYGNSLHDRQSWSGISVGKGAI